MGIDWFMALPVKPNDSNSSTVEKLGERRTMPPAGSSPPGRLEEVSYEQAIKKAGLVSPAFSVSTP